MVKNIMFGMIIIGTAGLITFIFFIQKMKAGCGLDQREINPVERNFAIAGMAFALNVFFAGEFYYFKSFISLIFLGLCFIVLLILRYVLEYKFYHENTEDVINVLKEAKYEDLSNRLLSGFEEFGLLPKKTFDSLGFTSYQNSWKEFYKIRIEGKERLLVFLQQKYRRLNFILSMLIAIFISWISFPVSATVILFFRSMGLL